MALFRHHGQVFTTQSGVGMTRVLLISNMFPDPNNPMRGVFVERVFDQLQRIDGLQVSTCVLRLKTHIALDYLVFYAVAIWRIVWLGKGVIYCHFVSRTGLLALLAKWILRRRVIINCHGSDVVVPANNDGFLHRINALVLKHSDRIIVPSEHFKGKLNELFELHNDQVVVYPSGGVFYPQQQDLAEKIPRKDYPLQLGFVGSLSVSKGLLVLIDAINRVHYPCALQVAGSGDLGLLYKIDNPQVEVVFHGVLNATELKGFYAALDLLLFPTLMPESLGLVPLEAMAFAVPVVASRLGAVSEYVHHGDNGFLVDAGDSDQLLACIDGFNGLPKEQVARLALGARETALAYDASKIFINLQAIFTRDYGQ